MSIKNIESNTLREVVQGKGTVQSTGRTQQGFSDQYGANPRPEYLGKGTTTTDVYSGGSTLNTYGADIPEDTVFGEDGEYPTCYSNHTPNGHIIECNDTPGSERIMIRHKDGMGVNIGPDGSIVISGQRRVEIINENYYLNVAGDGLMTFEGNLTLNVTGDFNLNVGGTYNVNSQEKHEVVREKSTRSVYADDIHTIVGNQSNFVTGGTSNTSLKGRADFVKGDYKLGVEGDMTIAGSTVLTMTAEKEVVITAEEANIAADNMSLFGDKGTIGGENVQLYAYNARIGHSIYAGDTVTVPQVNFTRADGTVVHADLQGTAHQSVTSDVTNSQNYADPDPGGGTGSAAGYSVASASETEEDTTESALPTADKLNDHRNTGSKGTKKVKIDPEDQMLQSNDRTIKQGGVSNRPLTSQEVRAKMREEKNRSNKEFISESVSQGKLSPEHAKAAPPNLSRLKNTDETIIQGQTKIGSVDAVTTAKRLQI